MDISGVDSTDTILHAAKLACGIHKPNKDMVDSEIAAVCRWIGSQAPDTVWVEGKPIIRRIGLDLMLSMAILQFPDFYRRHELSQPN